MIKANIKGASNLSWNSIKVSINSLNKERYTMSKRTEKALKGLNPSKPAVKVMSISDMTNAVKELPVVHNGSTGTAEIPVKLYLGDTLFSEGTGSEVFQGFGGKQTANTLKSLVGKLSRVKENKDVTIKVTSLDNQVIYSALNGVQAKLKV